MKVTSIWRDASMAGAGGVLRSTAVVGAHAESAFARSPRSFADSLHEPVGTKVQAPRKKGVQLAGSTAGILEGIAGCLQATAASGPPHLTKGRW